MLRDISRTDINVERCIFVQHSKNLIMTYIFIESEEQFEFGVSVGHQAYIVYSDLPFSKTFDSIEDLFLQFDNNQSLA